MWAGCFGLVVPFEAVHHAKSDAVKREYFGAARFRNSDLDATHQQRFGYCDQ
jgi:hypothetical protein